MSSLPLGVRRDRARGALLGLAIGDALGMPTEGMSPEEIRGRFGVIDRFHAPLVDAGLVRKLPAGRVTDDTDQAVIIGQLLVESGGRVDPIALAERLSAWERRLTAAGESGLLGPSTRRALDQIAEGVSPEIAGRWGDTNGAAMRIAPVGIAVPAQPLTRLVDAVQEASSVTHGTGIAIAGAAAVAAAVSAGIGGDSPDDALATAMEAAAAGARRGAYVGGADVAARLEWALSLVDGRDAGDCRELLTRLVGTGLATQESVPCALAVASLLRESPWEACCFAGGLGGDTDTIAAMAGAIVGAWNGGSAFPLWAVGELAVANPDLDLDALADDLLALRGSA